MIIQAIRWKRAEDERLSILKNGAIARVVVAKRPIVFVRVDGVLRALLDICPHQGRSFEGGWCDEGYIVCPFHRMHFDPVTGENKFGATSKVQVFPVEERDNATYVGIPYSTISVFGWKLW